MTKNTTFKRSQIALAIASIYLGSAGAANAAVVYTEQTAASVCNWTDTSCWNGGSLPGDSDKVGIVKGDYVTFNEDATVFIQHLRVGANVGTNKSLYNAEGESGTLILDSDRVIHSSDLKISQSGDIPESTTYDSAAGNILDGDGNIVADDKGFVDATYGLTSKVDQSNGLVWITTKDNSSIGNFNLSASGYAFDSDADEVADKIKPSASGHYQITGGELRVSGLSSVIRTGGNLDISGDATVDMLQMKAAGQINISGSQAVINLASWVAPGSEGSLMPTGYVNYKLDSTGVSAINISARAQADVVAANAGYDLKNDDGSLYTGTAAICQHEIAIDGSLYTAGSQTLDLITADAFVSDTSACLDDEGVASNSVKPASIAITGFAEHYQVTTTQTDTALTLNIVQNYPTVINFTGDVVEGATLTNDEQVTLTVDVADADGIASVEFFDGASSIGAGVDGGGTFTFDWTPSVEEAKIIKVVATDQLGTVTELSINVLVAADITDTDEDGVPDALDAFPNDPNETVDTDGDGVGDNADVFPEDASESADSDGDGIGNNADYYPDDNSRHLDDVTDSDSDGIPNLYDAFPNDASETVDSDGDGVGDNADVFPNDATETIDTDGDGVGDNRDDYPNDPNEFKNLIGDNPLNYTTSETLTGLTRLLSDTNTSLNVAQDVVLDCQKLTVGELTDEPCFKVAASSNSGIVINNAGTIDVTNDISNKANARALYITGNSIFSLTNSGVDSVIKAKDDAIRITGADVEHGIFNEGLITTGAVDVNGYRRAPIMLTGSDTNVSGGINNSGTISYEDELGLSTYGYAISAGVSSGAHTIDYIDNSGVINGEVRISDNTILGRIDNSGIIDGHVGALNTGGRNGAKIVDAYGSVTDYDIVDKIIVGTIPDVQIEDYVETFATNVVIGEINNSGSISGIVAFGVEEAVEGKVYNSAGGSVGTVKNANEINLTLVDDVDPDKSISTINGHFDFSEQLNISVESNAGVNKVAHLAVYGDVDITTANISFVARDDSYVEGSSFTFLTVHDRADLTESTLIESFAGTTITEGHLEFAISLSEDGRSLIATIADTTDSDGDGTPDALDAFPADASESADSDGDGVGDNADIFPNDASETIDSDLDGVGDNGDVFPNDASESADSDGDGVGNNADIFPDDASETIDSDSDGVGDNGDAFPNDASETIDTDGDGVGNNADAFDNDPSETTDTDGDGVGNNADVFPNDASESADNDGDGVGNNADIFPDDATETLDSDGDGVGDNADAFPNDASESQDSDGDGVGDNADEFPEDASKSVDSEPVLTIAGDILVAATDASGTAKTDSAITAFLTAASANDVDDGNIVVTDDAPEVFPIGATLVTFSVTDTGEHTVTAQATVTVVDQSLPEISLVGQSAITLSLNDEYVDAGFSAVDNVDGDITEHVTVAGDSVDTSSVGSYTISYNVADAAGNVAIEVTRTVIVQDVSAPVLSIPSNIIVAATNADGTLATDAQIAAFLTSASATDDVDENVSVTHDAPDTFVIGDNVVTFFATDNAGNDVSLQATVTVNDQTAPIITLMGDSSLTLTNEDSYIEQGASATDNVNGDLSADIVIGGDSVDTSTPGTYTVTYNVKDEAENTAIELVRIITVQDASAPVITAPANITVAATDANGTVDSNEAIAEFLVAATAIDTVDGSVAVTHDAPSVLPLGQTIVTFSSTDSDGYIGTSQAMITITDQDKPVISIAGDNAITVDINSEYSDLGVSAIDNVDGDITASIVISGDSVDTTVVGTYTVIYNVTDTAGNVADTVTRQITVQDASAPVVTAPDNIVVAATDSDGTSISNSIIGEFLIAASALDSVDGEVSVTDNAPNIFPIGVTTVTFSATDNAGNVGTAQAMVTIADQTAPVISLTGGVVEVSVGDDFVEPGVSAVDNVDGDISANITVSDTLDTSVAGTYTLTYQVSDAKGNAAEQVTRQVLVIDADSDGDGIIDGEDAFPEDPSETTDTDLDGVGDNSDAFPEDNTETADTDLDGVGDNSDAFPEDNTETTDTDLDGVGDNSDAFPEDSTETTDTDLDGVGDNGDAFPHDSSKSVDTAPVITAPTSISVAATDNSGTLSTNAQIAEFLTTASAIDVDDGQLIVSHDAPQTFPLGDTLVNFSAIDSGENAVSAQATVSVIDQTAPVITLNGVSSLTLTNKESYVEQGANATDNVDGDVSADIVTVGSEAVDTSIPGIYTVTYNVMDSVGNAASQLTRSITVQDVFAPVVIAPENITAGAITSEGTAKTDTAIAAFLLAATASDSIDGVVSVTHNAPEVFPLGETVVTFTATDGDNNTGSSQAIVTITDQDKPVITLVGKSAITLNLNSEYNEEGYSALDNVDGDMTANVVVAGTVNNNEVGTYTLSYNVVDEAGNKADTVTRQITVQDASAPVVTAPANIIVAATDSDGTSIADSAIGAFLGAASALDGVDGELSVTDNAPNVFPVGITTVTFSATDSAGNIGSAQATVTIADQTAPVISLTGGSVELFVGDDFVEPGVTALDNVDGDISENITVSEGLDTSTAGTYTLTYQVSDSAGNAGQATRQVMVLINDSDGDGIIDDEDSFPEDPNESSDTDLDGVGDNADAFPEDDTETTDTDLDGVGDNTDAFPEDATETTDTDGDGVGDVADNDDDNDGIIDADDAAAFDPLIGDNQAPSIVDVKSLTVEASGELTELVLVAPQVTDNNLNAPSIVSDLSQALPLGIHKVTWTATDFAGNKTTAEQVITVIDTTAPAFETLATKTINARGLLTDITAEIDVVANDSVDGEIAASLVGDAKYGAGSHRVTLMVNDSEGNTAYAEQLIHINPMVEIARGTNLAAGSHYILPITLSDQAAVYPVTINYELSGVIEGESSGEIKIDEGVSGQIELTIADSALVDETATVSLISASNAVITDEHSVFTVIEENIAPVVTLSVEQNGQQVSTIDTREGVVTVTASINDVNPLDEHDVSWSTTQSRLADLNTDDSALTFEFSPEQLESGRYGLSLLVAENNTDEAFAINLDSSLFIETELAALSDESDSDNDGIVDIDEGYSDSDNDGIADYLDDDSNVSRLPISTEAEPMQTVKGLALSLGDIVRQAGNTSAAHASIELEALAANGGDNGESAQNVTDINFTSVSSIINFNVSGLAYAGESVPVVIPLADNQVIPDNAVYKKYNLAKGWFDFVVDANNSLSSAMTDSDGNCPAPLSEVYTQGLNTGDNCIQLIIEDGGENDADNQVNGIIKDPGVLAVNGPNSAPVIEMISALRVDENSSVTLDASNTTDADADEISYQWTQTSGTRVELTGQDSAVLSFTAPSVTSTKALSFVLAVNDSVVTVTKAYTVLVDHVVELSVGIDAHDEQFKELSTVELTADVSLNSLVVPSYLWQQVSGPEVTLSESAATASSISFVAPEVSNGEEIEFKLTVSHGGTDVSATTRFMVVNDTKKSSGGSMAWLVAFGTLLLRLRGRDVKKR